MWIEVGNLNARVARATDDERSWISAYLSFTDVNARFRRGAGDDKVRMFNVITDTFPAGFLAMVKKAAADEKIVIETNDRRTCPTPEDPKADLAWLRDYQLEAVRRASARVRGIVWVPTGGGKTEIATGLTRIRPCRWLFIVHRTSLMHQAADRYELRNTEHGLGLPRAGRIGESSWDVPPDAQFVCATFQTLERKLAAKDPKALALLEWAEGVIVDECHVLPADSFWRTIQAFHNAYFRVGLSGTPLARGDKRSLLAIAALGPVVYRIKTDLLIDEGVLARPTIHMVEVVQRSDKPTWQGVYGDAIVRSAKRNDVVVRAAQVAEKPALVFIKEEAHGKTLTKLIERAGMRAKFIYGKHFEKARKSAVRDLVAGRLDVIVCSVVFQEGIDIPELRSVVNASGGKSVIAALQRIGRGMRVEKDAAGNVIKGTFDVYDVADKGCGCKQAAKELGTPGKGLHTGCKWLDRHTNDRVRAYVAEGHTVVREQWTVAAGGVARAPVPAAQDGPEDEPDEPTP